MDKKENTDSMPLDSTPVRDEQGSLVTENGGHSLLPSPLFPHPPLPRLRLEHWHIHAGGPERERERERSVQITIQNKNTHKKHGPCQDKPPLPITQIEEEHK